MIAERAVEAALHPGFVLEVELIEHPIAHFAQDRAGVERGEDAGER